MNASVKGWLRNPVKFDGTGNLLEADNYASLAVGNFANSGIGQREGRTS